MSRFRSLLLSLAALLMMAATATAQIATKADVDVNLAARDTRAIAVAPGSADNRIAFSSEPGSGRELFQVITHDASAVVSLLTPDGSEVNAGNAEQRGFGYQVINGADFQDKLVMSLFSSAGRHTLFVLPPFASRGTYQVKVNAAQVGTETVVVANYFSTSAIRAGVVTDAPTYRVGETITVSGVLFNGAEPLTGANVSAAVGATTDLSTPAAQVTMHDSGAASDLMPNDGIYTGTLIASQAGEFSVAMRGIGTSADGRSFSRVATTSFRVIPQLAQFDSFSDQGVDDDADGLIDRVLVAANVDVHRAGKYQFALTLEANSTKVNAVASAELTQGMRQIAVSFSLAELGTLAGDSPYVMKDAALTFQDDPDPPLADFRETVGNTSAYALPLAPPAIAFLGHTVAAGIDTDANSRFDILRVSSDVSASSAGLYTWSASLVDGHDREIDFYEGSAQLAAGNNVIVFDFDGHKIGRHHAHGPYIVRFVLITGGGNSVAVEEFFQTQAFSVHQFEGSDMLSPTTTATLSEAANSAGWHKAPVRVSLAAVDNPGGSGVRTITYSAVGAQTLPPTTLSVGASVLITSEGETTITYSSVDNLGNIEASQAVTIKLDYTAPEIVVTSPQPNSTYIVGQSVAALYTCSDAGSGLANCGGPFPSGGFLDTSATRDATFTVNALDRAGNASSLSTSYGVTYQIRVLYDEEKAHRAGSTIPFKLQLTNAAGVNLSSPGVLVTAIGVERVSDFAPGQVEEGGDEQPENDFRFDAFLGQTGGYQYNFKTTGLQTGSYVLIFRVSGDPITHRVRFQIK